MSNIVFSSWITCPDCTDGCDEHGEVCYTCQASGFIEGYVEEPTPRDRSNMPLNESGYCGCGAPINRGKYCDDCLD